MIKDIGRVVTGKTPPKKELEYFNGDYLFVSPKDLKFDSRYIHSTATTITSLAIDKFKNQILPPNTIMFTALSYAFGKIGIASDVCLTNQQINSVIVNAEKYDYNFVYYLLRNSKQKIFSYNAGIVTPIVPKSVFEKILLQVPLLPTQRHIASILSAYDDLIENNLRRIKLLEEAAQNIYREWFVEIRFPDREKVEWYSDEQGRRLPVGWKYAPLMDICELTMGQSPKSEYYNDNNDGLPFHQGVTGFGLRFVEDSTYCTMPTRIANEGDILCSVRAPVGRLNITMNKIIIGRGLSAIRNRQGFQSFQYYQLKSHFYQEDMIGGGAIFNSVTKKELSEQLLLLPSTEYLEQFECVGRNIDHQIQNLSIQNERLQEARDILLPRLMNQTIQV